MTLFTVTTPCTDLLALKDAPLPSRSCVLPYAICKITSADMLLVSIAVWSVLQNLLGAAIVFSKIGNEASMT